MWILSLILLIVLIILAVRIFSGNISPFAFVIGGVIIGIYAILIIIGGVYNWHKEPKPILTDNAPLSFIQQMNPILSQKMTEIQAEIAVAEQKLEQLHELKKAFPSQSQMIDDKMTQWQSLKNQLSQVLDEIHRQIETVYVAYKIDEIEGEQKLTVLSKQLLTKANAVLANAQTTKSIIEKQLDE
jgi:hypothetical protein